MSAYAVSSYALRAAAVCIAVLTAPVHPSGAPAAEHAGKKASHDCAYSTTIAFTVRRNTDGKYDVRSETAVRMELLSKRATRERVHKVRETFFVKVKDLKARHNRRPLRKKDFGHYFPQRSDIFLSDYAIHTITFPKKLKEGDVITYSFDSEYHDPAFVPLLHVPNVDYLEEMRIVVNHFPEVTPTFEVFFPRDSVPYRLIAEGPGETHLVFGTLQEVKPLPFFPYNEQHATVLVMFEKDGHPLTPSSFETFLAWYKRFGTLAPALEAPHKDLLRQEIESLSDPLDKLRIIHNFVRDTVRYVADVKSYNAYAPHSPAEVLKRRYGDCKDRAALATAIAREHNLPVCMALVNTTPVAEFPQPHVNLWDHMICAYTGSKPPVFFDPTAKYIEFTNLPERDIDARGLILHEQDGALVVVGDPRTEPSLAVAIEGSVDDPEKTDVTIVLRNELNAGAARAKRELTGVELENYLSNVVTSHLSGISIDYFELAELTEEKAVFDATADLSDYVVVSPTRKYVPHTPFVIVDNTILERADDGHPVYFDKRIDMELSIALAAKGHSFKEEAVEIGSGTTVHFRSRCARRKPSTALFTYSYTDSPKTLAGKEKANYLGFCKEYFVAKKNMYVLSGK